MAIEGAHVWIEDEDRGLTDAEGKIYWLLNQEITQLK
jgi:hypothetical protein